MQKEEGIGEKEPRAKISASEKLLVVDFYADWCGPCRMVSPIIENLAKEYDGSVEFLKVDVDKNASLAREYNILAIPTLILTKRGRVLFKITGVQSTATYRDKINLALKSN
ncbi:MAG: thioredoxin [Nitrososphaerota archaeon]|jgi:thioredoxin 1|nr:thioredoxin [Nitrososphaerota archaeon]